jgi:hypothetical protein
MADGATYTSVFHQIKQKKEKKTEIERWRDETKASQKKKHSKYVEYIS